MKKRLLLAILGMLTTVVHAQIDLGVKGGLSMTNIKTNTSAGDYQITSQSRSQLGYHAGVFLHAALFGMFIQPELVFTSVASEFTVTDIHTFAEQLAQQRIGRIDAPVLVGAKLGNLRLALGPVGSIIVSDHNELTDITGYETKVKSATIGYQVGVGLDIWKAGIDIRYEGNLSKLGDQIVVGGEAVKFDSRAKQVIFSLSYRF
jgi:hypothetical protein